MIKRSVHVLMAESRERFLGNVAMMDYYFHQMCIKHEVEALLPIEVMHYGQTFKIEEVAQSSYGEDTEEDEDKIYVYPNDNSYLTDLLEAIFKVHPDFGIDIITNEQGEDEGAKSEKTESMPAFGSKIEEKAEEEEDDEEQEPYRYIMLTMPAVTKEKRDSYHQIIGQLYDFTKGKLDAEKVQLEAKVAVKTVGYTKEDLDKCKELIDALYDESAKQAKQIREDKDAEVDRGYERYLKKQAEKEANPKKESKTSESKPASSTSTSTKNSANKENKNDIATGDGKSLKLF